MMVKARVENLPQARDPSHTTMMIKLDGDSISIEITSTLWKKS